MKISTAALATLIALGGPAPLTAAAMAQYGSPPTPPPTAAPPRPSGEAPPPAAAPQRQYDVSRREQAAMLPALQAAERSDWAAAQAALPAAIEAARGPDAKYVIAQIRLRIGIGLNDRRIQAQAVDELIASGGAQPSEMRGLYENQLEFATAAGDTAKAARATAALDAMTPNDPNRFVRQAMIRVNANDPAGAIGLYRQAIQAQQAAGQAVPPEWLRQIAGIAYQARMPEAVPYMREFLVAQPSPANWHDTLAIYAELGNANPALKLDIFRLMRAAGAMTSERDYIEHGEAANSVRIWGEVKAVLEEGLRRNLITTNAAFARERLGLASGRVAVDRASLASERAALAASDGTGAMRLADAYFGYGEYAPAAELYRAALGGAGQDANLLNIRLGAALALAGNRAAAETAFRAVTGPRAELATLWLLWLSTRG